MKRLMTIILMCLLLAGLLSACAKPDTAQEDMRQSTVPDGTQPGTTPDATQQETTQDDKLSIVCTTFPQYDWVRQILGERAEQVDLTFLLNTGVDLHSYQPTVDDIAQISTCDLFIYVGGESDAWVDDALAEATNPDMQVISLLGAMGEGAKIEDIVEGMEEEEGHEHAEETGEAHEEHAEESAYDEHVWLSLRNAGTLCAVITDALIELDPDNAQTYQNNLSRYTETLTALDAAYTETADAAPVKTLLFGDRFPFRYLVDDYGITYYAAFPGCSAETEASFETIAFLAQKADELALHNIMITESADRSIAETIIGNSADQNRQILVMDAMQSVTAEDVENGVSYLSIMEENLNVLEQGLQ